MSDLPIFTYQTRLRASPEIAKALDQYGVVYGHAQRSLFARIAAGESAPKIKSEFSKEHGLTARQFNAMRIELDGKIASIKERRKGLISDAQQRIKKLAAKVKKLSINPDAKSAKSGAKFELPEKKVKRRFDLHHKKRRLVMLQSRLSKMQADDAAQVTRLCFGSKKLFHAQFDLAANQYGDHADWKHDWDASRSSQFFVLGSKDELAGNQSCQATVASDGSLTLRLRTPDALGQYTSITGVYFAYGNSEILAALNSSQRIKAKTTSGTAVGKEISKLTGTALSYRFVRDDKSWSIFVSVQASAMAITSNAALGAIGIDTNANHLAVVETDRFGNLVHARRIDTPTYGKSTDQAKAILGDAAVMIAARAKAFGKPVVIESLDFAKKKAELKKTDPRYARMLSSFACNKTASSIKAACFRAGVEIIEVAPAYTSVIGAVNHARVLGISAHQGAAFAIARRGLGLSERPTVSMGLVPVRNGGHVTFELPVRNRSKHVWSFWSGVRTRLKAAHVEHYRCADHKKPAPPLPLEMRALGASRSTTAKFRGANRQDNCSPDVLGDVPW